MTEKGELMSRPLAATKRWIKSQTEDLNNENLDSCYHWSWMVSNGPNSNSSYCSRCGIQRMTTDPSSDNFFYSSSQEKLIERMSNNLLENQ